MEPESVPNKKLAKSSTSIIWNWVLHLFHYAAPPNKHCMNHVNRKQKSTWNLKSAILHPCILFETKKDVHQKISGVQILYQYKSKKHELDCFSPFVQIQMPIPIIGNSFPCNWFLCLSLYQHRSKKNYFTLFGSLIREACNKMKVWLPTSDDHTIGKYSIYWHMANFPEKQQDSAAVNHLGDLHKLHMILEIK